MSKMRIAVVAGSTRPHRSSRLVADWVLAQARDRQASEYELIDLADYDLPMLDEPNPPSLGRYDHEHTLAWAEVIARFDGFVFVTPEYNHSTSAALKNALDYLYAEWHDKVAAFVSYGYGNGLRAVEHLRQIVSALSMAHVSAQVSLSVRDDFDTDHAFTPADRHARSLATLLHQLERWGGAMRTLRTSTPAST